MSKKILVPTDFSKNAHKALDYAIALAKKQKSAILLAHAYPIQYTGPEVPLQFVEEELGIMAKKAEKKLEAFRKKVMEESKVKCTYVHGHGPAVPFILDLIAQKKPYLTVMGTKGASGLKKIFIGSNTAEIVEKAKCPVIAVPQKTRIGAIHHITYSTDYRNCDVEAVKSLVAIAKLFKAKLTLLHFSDEDDAIEFDIEDMKRLEKKIKARIRYNKLSFKIAQGNSFSKTLDRYVKVEKPDLLAMTTFHRNFLEKLVASSMTKQMAYHTSVPLLAFHFKKNSVIFI